MKGAWLSLHVDQLPTHVLSVILQVGNNLQCDDAVSKSGSKTNMLILFHECSIFLYNVSFYNAILPIVQFVLHAMYSVHPT